jgi:carboxyl-terminal processing protease
VFAAGYLTAALPGRGAHHTPTAPSVLDQAEKAIEARADADVSTTALTTAAIRAMLATLHDRWATYYPPGTPTSGPDALTQLTTGRYGGLGVWLAPAGGRVLVTGVQQASPAALAGLRPGEEIQAVDGRSSSQLGVSGVVAALQGPVGSSVRLVVADTDADTDAAKDAAKDADTDADTDAAKDAAKDRDTATYATRVLTLRRALLRAGNVTVDQVAPGILRIAVTSFSRGVGAEVAGIVRQARRHHVGGLILDLRDNPGGLLSEALAVASAFLDGGPVVTLSGRHVPPEVLDAPRGGDTTTPLAVLVNGGTASAAEVVAGALQDRDRAVLVGSRTFGKGTVQQPIALSDGAVIELTVARYRTPDGRNINGIGLTPDVTVPADANALTQAIRVLVGLESSPATTPAADVSGN